MSAEVHDIPAVVLAGVSAEEVISRSVPALSGVVVLSWYAPRNGDERRWTAHGPFADRAKAERFVDGLNDRHWAALIVPVEWRPKP